MDTIEKFKINNVDYLMDYNSLANRPGTETRELFYPEVTLSIDSGSDASDPYFLNQNFTPMVGDWYVITINDVEYRKQFNNFYQFTVEEEFVGIDFDFDIQNPTDPVSFFISKLNGNVSQQETYKIKIEHLLSSFVSPEALPEYLRWGKNVRDIRYYANVTISSTNDYSCDLTDNYCPATWHSIQLQTDLLDQWVPNIDEDCEYIINFDGVDYYTETHIQAEYSLIGIGSADLQGSWCLGDYSGEKYPFFILENYGGIYLFAEAGEHTIKIYIIYHLTSPTLLYNVLINDNWSDQDLYYTLKLFINQYSSGDVDLRRSFGWASANMEFWKYRFSEGSESGLMPKIYGYPGDDWNSSNL